MTDKTRLHLIQMSSSFKMSDGQYQDDLRFAASKDPDVMMVTETSSRELANTLGYRVVSTRGADNDTEVTIYLHRRHKLINHGQVAGGSYFSRVKKHKVFSPILWVSFRVGGHLVYVHESHWAPSTTDGGHITPGGEERYLKGHLHTTQVMVNQVKLHAKSKNVSFFAGDLNVSEVADNRENNNRLPNHIFNSNGLITIYDELGVAPSEGGTHGSAIYDIIGSYSKDKAVKGIRYNIWPKQHSDHRYVSAWYDLTHVQRSGVGGGGTAETPTDFLTGGNRSFADYQDNEIYDMPVATDDSDDLDPHG